jgi:hypothetical protein
MKLTSDQVAMFRDLETSLHRHEVRASRERASAFIADDFVEFGKSGKVYDKATVLTQMQSEQPGAQIPVEDFVARALAPDVVLVTYRTSALRSSIWVRRQGKWQLVFHQGTP